MTRYSEINNPQYFAKIAGQIHDKHIRESESADVKIATKRIEQYFKGELNLTWKSIIYEINKLPELQRNKYFKDLCETEIIKAKVDATNLTYKNIKQMNFFERLKFLLKGL